MRSIAILQSNYIPWRGTFDLMAAVDEFVLLDTVQFTKNDWRNRNRIRTPQGPQWLTIPVRSAGRFGQRIADTEIDGSGWAGRHFKSIVQNYSRGHGFGRYADGLHDVYCRAANETRLAQVNRMFLDFLRSCLQIGTRLTSSADYPDHADRVERLIGICHAAQAERYVSGPAARAYLDPARFAAAGIEVRFFDYQPCAEPRFSAIDEVLRA